MTGSRLKGRVRTVVLALVAVALAGGGIWQLLQAKGGVSGKNVLSASGTVEARTVKVAPEIGGRVLSVSVDEGQQVAAGQVLVEIDDAAFQAQLASAQGALAAAQANYDLLVAGPTDEQVRQAQSALDGAQARLDGLKAGARSEQVAQAEANLGIAQARLAALERGGRPQQVAQATANLAAAQAALDRVLKGPTAEDITLAELAVDQAKNALWAAQASRDGICGSSRNPDYMCDAAEAQVAAGETGVQQAQERLAQLKIGASAETVTQSQSAVDAAAAQLALVKEPASTEDVTQAQDAVRLAEAQLALVKDPVTGHDLAVAQAAVAGAQAQLDALRAGARPQQLQAAQAQVAMAQAQVETVQVQLAKLTLVAPIDGVVLTRSVEPLEMVSPGGLLMVIGDLRHLKVTVYLPEEKYALVDPGQEAELYVDAYPGRTFAATVVRIADQAEFTPRNVQTVEGRKDTVFAVHLSIDNDDLALKPGLPADVTFGRD